MSETKRKPKRKSFGKIIEDVLSFTNGWGVPECRYQQLCNEAAKRVLRAAKRREAQR